MKYKYDAAGNKLNVLIPELYLYSHVYGSDDNSNCREFDLSMFDKEYDYCGNMLYENGTLKQILIDGGYITFNGSTPQYHFYLKDHLGNNRVVLNAGGGIEQVNHYYSFGGLMGESTNGDVQTYKYNGKELDRMNGLDWYDYGARHMDGIRFTTIDPMAEKYYGVSPYVYCADSPVNAFDPTGNDWVKSTRNDYIWMDNVTSYKNVPEGYSYIGNTGEDILQDLNINSSYNIQYGNVGALGFDGDESRGGTLVGSNYSLTGALTAEALIEIDSNMKSSNNKSGLIFKGIRFEAYFNQKGLSTNSNTELLYKGNLRIEISNNNYYSPLKPISLPALQEYGSNSLMASFIVTSNQLKSNLVFRRASIEVGALNPSNIITKAKSFSWNLFRYPIIIQK